MRRPGPGRGAVLASITIAFVAAGAGCSTDGEARIPIEVRDGTSYVTNPDVGLWEQAGNEVDARFELEQVFGEPGDASEAMLADPRKVAVDDHGRVFVLDSYDNRLLAFDSDGELAWVAGGEGQGPGELERPRGLAWDRGERILVANGSGTRLDAWQRTDGRFLGTVAKSNTETGSFGEIIGAVSPEVVVVVRGRRGKLGADAAQMRIGSSSEQVKVFGLSPLDTDLPGSVGMRTEIFLSGGLIGAGSLARYEVRQFTPDGRLVRLITRPSVQLPGPAIDMENGAAGSNGSVQGPFSLGEYLLVFGYWPANVEDPLADLRRRMSGERTRQELTYLLDLLDSQGRLLRSWRWEYPDKPDYGQILGTGPAGKLYTFAEEPFAQIRRYRLEVGP